MKKIEALLKNYSNLKAEILTLESRIDMFKQLLSLEDLSEYYEKNKELFKTPLVPRPTEAKALEQISENKYKLHNLAKRQIEKELNYVKSELFSKQNLLNIVNICLKALTEIQEYIIKCIYFNKMTLDNITKNLQNHKKYKNKNSWCKETVFNYKKRAIKIMQAILNSYFSTSIVPIF